MFLFHNASFFLFRKLAPRENETKARKMPIVQPWQKITIGSGSGGGGIQMRQNKSGQSSAIVGSKKVFADRPREMKEI